MFTRIFLRKNLKGIILACIKFCFLIHFVTYSLKLFIDDRLVVKRRDEMKHEEDLLSSFLTRDFSSQSRLMSYEQQYREMNLRRRRKYLAAIIRISNSLWDMGKVC